MFDEYSSSYFEKDLDVVPLKGKRPFTGDWVNRNHSGRSFRGCNIGLKTGEKSGVICIDIDTEDVELQKKIYALLPPVFCGKVGNPSKGINYFFKYNGEQNRKIGGIVELLSTGNQTVLPPSNHPNGYPYKWVGRPLLEIDLDDLPDMPSDFLQSVEKLATGNVTNNPLTKGRHNSLIEIASAMISRDEPVETIVKELMDYDKVNHDNPYFDDKSEAHRGNGYTSALKMVTSLVDTHTRKGGTYNPSGASITIGSVEKVESKNYKRKKYPKFRGVAQEMFEYIYANSPVPRSRLACASVLSLMSITLANKVKINGIHPNLYALMVAPSGFGKDFPLKFVKRALMESGCRDLIGQSMPASDTGIIKTLDKQRERIDIIDEASILFGAISSGKNDYSSKMADVYAALYTSTGDYYEGKVLASSNKVIGACHSPYVSILGAMTPAAASETLTTQLVETGLGARFLYFVDDQKKRGRLTGERPAIPRNVTRFIKMWRSSSDSERLNIATGFAGETAKQAKVADMDILTMVYDEIENQKQSVNSKIAPLLNRAFPIICKLALIDACSMNHMSTDIVVDNSNIAWAMDFFKVNFKESTEFLLDSVSGSRHERDLNKVHDFIKSKKFSGATMSELAQGLRAFDSRHRKSLLADLLESEKLLVTKEGTTGRPISRFFSHKYAKKG